ncbi:hypothetical protein DRP05_13720 [Archaeoglobales archaeon]|nr:MAG: hypothetical protein DRP05_13720 [Archaeoglobales archaeon]
MVIHLCENEGFCTADCELRPICKKQRINFLIYAVVVDYKENTVYPDEYLNEIAILKQSLVDIERRHQSGNKINVFERAKIKLTSL